MVASAGQSHAIADQLGSDPLMRRDPMYTREVTNTRRDSQIRRAPNSAGLYEVLDLILDKGIVIDAFVRVSLVGIELLTIDLRVVIASVDTYLRYAEGVERLGWYNRDQSKKLPDVMEGVEKGKALKKGAESVGRLFHGDAKAPDEHEGGAVGALSRGVRKVVGKLVGSDDDDDSGDEGHDDDERHERRQMQRSERKPERANRGNGR